MARPVEKETVAGNPSNPMADFPKIILMLVLQYVVEGLNTGWWFGRFGL
jgi:hypothetical protein